MDSQGLLTKQFFFLSAPSPNAAAPPAELALYRALAQLQFAVMCEAAPTLTARVRAYLQVCSEMVEAAPVWAANTVDLPTKRHIMQATITCLSQV